MPPGRDSGTDIPILEHVNNFPGSRWFLPITFEPFRRNFNLNQKSSRPPHGGFFQVSSVTPERDN